METPLLFLIPTSDFLILYYNMCVFAFPTWKTLKVNSRLNNIEDFGGSKGLSMSLISKVINCP